MVERLEDNAPVMYFQCTLLRCFLFLYTYIVSLSKKLYTRKVIRIICNEDIKKGGNINLSGIRKVTGGKYKPKWDKKIKT